MTEASRTKPNILQGRRILVVEDEYMLADEVAEMLVQAGAEPLGPVPRVIAAMTLLERENRVDAALLDVNLNNEPIWPVVDRLLTRGVPVVLATGYDASAIPAAYAHLPRCEKPTTGADLSQALERVLLRSPLPG